jgi:hypothetical protein
MRLLWWFRGWARREVRINGVEIGRNKGNLFIASTDSGAVGKQQHITFRVWNKS